MMIEQRSCSRRHTSDPLGCPVFSGAGLVQVQVQVETLVWPDQRTLQPCETAGGTKSENPHHISHTCMAAPMYVDERAPGARPSG